MTESNKLASYPQQSMRGASLVDEDAYYSKNGEIHIQKRSGDAKNIDPRELTLEPGNMSEDGISVFYFDKNRARHLISGTYRTTFDSICEDLNWRFQKSLREHGSAPTYAINAREFFNQAVDLAQKGTGSKLAEEFADFFDNSSFRGLRFELLSLLEPFSTAFLAVREDDQVRQIPVKNLGSGVELILALLLQRLLSQSAKGQRILLIDEPEMHLHPIAQRKLADLLLEESSYTQILLSSHSPYLLQLLLTEGTTNVFRHESNNGISIELQRSAAGYFPWSPSFGEVNLKAFGIPTVELHNELYGWLQERNGFRNCSDVDQLLNSKGIPSDHKWINAKSGRAENVTECTFVRHSIHHPENRSNAVFDDAKLLSSIEKLTACL